MSGIKKFSHCNTIMTSLPIAFAQGAFKDVVQLKKLGVKLCSLGLQCSPACVPQSERAMGTLQACIDHRASSKGAEGTPTVFFIADLRTWFVTSLGVHEFSGKDAMSCDVADSRIIDFL